MVSRFVIDQLKLPLIGEIVSRFLPASCVLERGECVKGVQIHGNKTAVVFSVDYPLETTLENLHFQMR